MKKKAVLYAIFSVHIVMAVVVLRFLPAEVPFHWNWKGEVDQWVPARSFVWMSLLPITLYFILGTIVPRIDPKHESWKIHGRAYGIVITVISCMFIPLHWLIAVISVGIPVRMDIVIRLLVGTVFLVSGNYMGKFRHNYFCGIRTPWTLASETVWRKTHRCGAVVFIVMGLLMVLGACIPHRLTGALVSLSGIVGIPYLVVYSWIVYRNENKAAQEDKA